MSWEITSRCPSDCIYCGRQQESPGEELDTAGAISLIEQAVEVGCIRISLTGGEPFLRDDLPDILSACSDAGIEVNINTSGIGAAEKIKDLKGIGSITISLDGLEDINDSIRGKGAFKEAMMAVSAGRDAGIPVSLLCVLSGKNLDSLPEFLDFIKKEKLPTGFQPADQKLLRGKGENPIAPDPDALKKAIEFLLEEKKKNIYIDSPGRLLRHFKQYPESDPLPCAGGFIFCRVDPQGHIWRCGRIHPPGEGLSFLENGLKKSFEAASLVPNPEIPMGSCPINTASGARETASAKGTLTWNIQNNKSAVMTKLDSENSVYKK